MPGSEFAKKKKKNFNRFSVAPLHPPSRAPAAAITVSTKISFKRARALSFALLRSSFFVRAPQCVCVCVFDSYYYSRVPARIGRRDFARRPYGLLRVDFSRVLFNLCAHAHRVAGRLERLARTLRDRRRARVPFTSTPPPPFSPVVERVGYDKKTSLLLPCVVLHCVRAIGSWRSRPFPLDSRQNAVFRRVFSHCSLFFTSPFALRHLCRVPGPVGTNIFSPATARPFLLLVFWSAADT